MINVLIVDDYSIVRSGMRSLLSTSPIVKVVGEAAQGGDALRLAKQLSPNVVLMDIQLPDMDGLEVTRKLVRYDPKIKIIIISMLSEEPYPSRLLEAGAAGYLSKECDPQEILKAIQEVTSGKRYISTLIAQQLALKQITGETTIDQLSLREMQVMMMLIAGKSINDISATFFVTPKTIQACRRQLFKKLKVKSDVQLLLLAKRLGWEKVAQQ